jgi:hypothetical protein
MGRSPGSGRLWGVCVLQSDGLFFQMLKDASAGGADAMRRLASTKGLIARAREKR